MYNSVLAASWFEQIANFFNQLISGFQFVVDHFVSMGKATANLFTVIPSALALPGYISSAVPFMFLKPWMSSCPRTICEGIASLYILPVPSSFVSTNGFSSILYHI